MSTFGIGATPVADGVFFRVWAPSVTSVDVELVGSAPLKAPLHQHEGRLSLALKDILSVYPVALLERLSDAPA